MEIYGLIGKKLNHTFSPAYFKKKFQDINVDADYQCYETNEISDLPELIRDQNLLIGLNVTVPYKESIIPFLDEIDPLAKAIGAVNTVKITRKPGDINLKGYNTDAIGFDKALSPIIRGKNNLHALILGTGGSSKSVKYVLEQKGIKYQFISRRPHKGMMDYQSLSKQIIKSHLLIINTTPLGMFPDIQNCPEIPYQFLTNQHILFDLIYNPDQTLFLKNGIANGAKIQNGIEMLRFQAEASWKIWTEEV